MCGVFFCNTANGMSDAYDLVVIGACSGGGGVFEARYRYRATVSACNGTAIVRTETVREQVMIRSIRANC